MGRVIALIPARAGSKGIENKNFRPWADGLSCADLALRCARRAGIPAYDVFLSTDYDYPDEPPDAEIAFRVIHRPADLASDSASMIAVVQHALAQIPGDGDDILVLLQPTQPLRTPAQVRAAIALLRETGADSVVSVVEVPDSYRPDLLLWMDGHGLRLMSFMGAHAMEHPRWSRVTRRQDAERAWRRDGTVYACYRRTVTAHGSLYGRDCRPLLIDPAESCELDSEADWDALVARWALRSA